MLMTFGVNENGVEQCLSPLIGRGRIPHGAAAS